MSDENENLNDDPSLEGDYVEIDWGPLQAAINAMADEGLDIDDNEVVRDHMAALLASLLRRVQAENDLSDEELAEAAAEVASLAVQIAIEGDEVPTFEPTEDDYETEEAGETEEEGKTEGG